MELTRKTEMVSIAGYLPLPGGDIQYSSDFIETHCAIVLKEEHDTVTVGVCNTGDAGLKEILTHFHDKKITYRLIDHDELSEYLGKRNAAVDETKPASAYRKDEKLLLDRIASDAPVINLVNSTIIEAIRKRASDIHIEALQNEVRVRYRIDGVLQTHNTIALSMFPALSSRLKIMADMNIMERRLPQDGRTSVHLGGYIQDIRVSIVPTARGESIVLRLLNRKSAHFRLEQLGLQKESLTGMKKLLATPFGLILATGPTGSGKTTTLNSMLKEMDSGHRKIITVEDPVEYNINGIDQIQTNEAIGLTFNSILKRILRQDPDVIMVGEIRDSETAHLSIRAALTGHLVLSTLHTNDSISVIDRLRDMGVESFMIAAVLKASMAQRLVRKLCPSCRIKQKISSTQKKFFPWPDGPPEYLYVPAGCDACGGSGYHGRTLVHEYFSVDEKMERMIAEGAHRAEMAVYLEKAGMVTLLDDGLEKVKAGITSLRELETVIAV